MDISSTPIDEDKNWNRSKKMYADLNSIPLTLSRDEILKKIDCKSPLIMGKFINDFDRVITASRNSKLFLIENGEI